MPTDPAAVEDPDEIRFWTTSSPAGRVHVHDRFVSGVDIGRFDMPFNPWMRSRCGRLAREQSAHYLSSFEDNQLCLRCHRATPDADQRLLFEHD